MHVLITGGTGYIGSTIALDLAARGHAVTVAARAPSRGSTRDERARQLREAGVRFVYADLGRRGELAATVDDATAASVDAVVHGVCSFLEPARGESLTLCAMRELLSLAPRLTSLTQAIVLSNNLVHEPRPGDFADESYPCRPETAHGRNKLAAEKMLERSGLPWVVPRIPQVYGGVGSSFDWVMLDPIRRGAFPVPCDGRNAVSLVHVDDVAQAARLVIERGVSRRVYNVATGERDVTLGAVFDVCARGFGLAPPRRLPRAVALAFMGAAERLARLRGREPTMVADMVRTLAANRTLDASRARRELGFEPAYPRALDGIRAAYADVFAGNAPVFAPAGRLAAAQGEGARS